jgi:hypothetical protein
MRALAVPPDMVCVRFESMATGIPVALSLSMKLSNAIKGI